MKNDALIVIFFKKKKIAKTRETCGHLECVVTTILTSQHFWSLFYFLKDTSSLVVVE